MIVYLIQSNVRPNRTAALYNEPNVVDLFWRYVRLVLAYKLICLCLVGSRPPAPELRGPAN